MDNWWDAELDELAGVKPRRRTGPVPRPELRQTREQKAAASAERMRLMRARRKALGLTARGTAPKT